MRADRRPDMAYNEERLQEQEAAEEFEACEVDGLTNDLSRFDYIEEMDWREDWDAWLRTPRGAGE